MLMSSAVMRDAMTFAPMLAAFLGLLAAPCAFLAAPCWLHAWLSLEILHVDLPFSYCIIWKNAGRTV